MNVMELLYCTSAMTTEITTKTTSKTRIHASASESSILLRNTGLMKSSVSVELEVRTSEESVDIEAESTMITMMPIKMSGSPESIVGMIES